MTPAELRDHFAGQAMRTFIANEADAMMLEREKP